MLFRFLERLRQKNTSFGDPVQTDHTIPIMKKVLLDVP